MRVDNNAARALYESEGFTAIANVSRYYADGSDAVRLERSLWDESAWPTWGRLPVVDDSASILRCTNKVFLADLLPNIDVGMEDAALGDELYRKLLEFFMRRADELRAPAG